MTSLLAVCFGFLCHIRRCLYSFVAPVAKRFEVIFTIFTAINDSNHMIANPGIPAINLATTNMAMPTVTQENTKPNARRNGRVICLPNPFLNRTGQPRLLLRPRLISEIVDLVTPNLRARSTPDERVSSLISNTCALLNLAMPCFSPARSGLRPFRIISAILSACVATKRWSGFTQSLTSHLWQIFMPSGIVPLKAIHDARWAETAFPFVEVRPYPARVTAFIQIQHPASVIGVEPCIIRSLSGGYFGICFSQGRTASDGR